MWRELNYRRDRQIKLSLRTWDSAGPNEKPARHGALLAGNSLFIRHFAQLIYYTIGDKICREGCL